MARNNNNNPLSMAASMPWWYGVSVSVILLITGEAVKHIQAGFFPGTIFIWPLRIFAGLFMLGGIVSFIKGRGNENSDNTHMSPEMRAELAAKEKVFNEANPICPHCNKHMVLRVAQRGATAGSKFWGCSNYPACRHTMPVA